MARATNFLHAADPAARRDELVRFIGRSHEAYLRVYDLMHRRQRLGLVWNGFCWPAFFGGPVWCFYRRMWWRGAVLSLIMLIGMVTRLLPLALIAAANAGMARRAYVLFAMKRLEALRASGRIDQPGLIERKGGVSRLAVWIGAPLYLLVFLLFVIVSVSLKYAPPPS